MTIHEKVIEVIRFIHERGYILSDTNFAKGLHGQRDFASHFYKSEANSGNFHTLLKQIFPQAEPYFMMGRFVRSGIYSKIGFRFYNIDFEASCPDKSAPSDEETLKNFSNNDGQDDRFKEDIAKAKEFYKTLPETKLTDEEVATLKELSQLGDKTLEEVKPLMNLSCDFKFDSCAFMREEGAATTCCTEYECTHVGDDGCKLGEEKPLFCKTFLCKLAQDKFALGLKNENPDLISRYGNVMKTLVEGDHIDLLRKEWEMNLN